MAAQDSAVPEPVAVVVEALALALALALAEELGLVYPIGEGPKELGDCAEALALIVLDSAG